MGLVVVIVVLFLPSVVTKDIGHFALIAVFVITSKSLKPFFQINIGVSQRYIKKKSFVTRLFIVLTGLRGDFESKMIQMECKTSESCLIQVLRIQKVSQLSLAMCLCLEPKFQRRPCIIVIAVPLHSTCYFSN